MPSGKIDSPIIEDNRDGTIRIQYDPKEDGIHELVLSHNGTTIEGEFWIHFVYMLFKSINECEI